MVETLFWIVTAVVGVLLVGVVCLLIFLLPTPFQFYLSRSIVNKKTGKPLSNNNYKFPLGDLTASLQDFAQGEGSRFKYFPENACGWWALNNYDVQLTNADWVGQLMKIPEVYIRRSFDSFTVLQRLMGKSIVGVEGETWQRFHRILYKAFAPINLEKFVPVFVKQTHRLAEKLDSAIQTREPVEMLLAFNKVALDIVADVGFGDEVTPEDRSVFMHALRHVLEETQNPIHDIPLIRLLPLPVNLEFERQFKNLQDTANKIVRERRAQHEKGSASVKHEGKYMVDLLLEAKDSGDAMTDEELRDNIIALMVAGSETSGTCLTWTLWHVLSHPEVHKKVLAEVDALDISWDHFHVQSLDREMPYLTMVLKETLRVTPSLSGIPQRILTTENTVGDLHLPAGSRIGVASWVLHHNPQYWPDPNKYEPERFTTEASKDRSPFAYMPFSGGHRSCIGKLFAMNEMRVILALIFKYYHFEYDTSKGPVKLHWKAPTVVPKNGMYMFITRR